MESIVLLVFFWVAVAALVFLIIRNRRLSAALALANEGLETCSQSMVNLRAVTNEEMTKVRGDAQALNAKYSLIIDMDAAVAQSAQEKSVLEEDIAALRQSYHEKREIFDKLVRQVAIYDETIEMIELGFYKPHYDFKTSEEYKRELEKIKEKQKRAISDKKAVQCSTEWSIGGSAAEGRKFIDRGIRLTLRAFNNECDAAIANTRWNNAERMETRIEKAFDALNKLNESSQIYIDHKYYELKLSEFRLAHEYQEKKQAEREEQAELRLQMREEAKLEQEKEAALKEEERYQKMLDKAKADAQKASGEKLSELEEKIALLSADLAEAHAKSERALSMAQQTRAGHVYVISNIGAFGQDVYKIGMTRRLDPNDRVKELGDASVPFEFDIHAMIYCEDAPSLENTLHKAFDEYRLNLVNTKQEFFNVQLLDIQKLVKATYPDAEFYLTAEARHYTETLAIRAERDVRKTNAADVELFPAEI